MDRDEHRRQRLQLLIAQQCGGNASECARRMKKPASYVSRLLYPAGKAGKRKIADGMIRAIEDAFNLPPGWLDGTEQDPALADMCRQWPELPEYKRLAIYSLFKAIADADDVAIPDADDAKKNDANDVDRSAALLLERSGSSASNVHVVETQQWRRHAQTNNDARRGERRNPYNDRRGNPRSAQH